MNQVDLELSIHRDSPARYTQMWCLVNAAMAQQAFPCRGGECDEDGHCARHARFSADRCVALCDRWRAAEARTRWLELPVSRATAERLFPVGSCHRVRELESRSVHWVRVELSGFGGVGFYRLQDSQPIDVDAVQVAK